MNSAKFLADKKPHLVYNSSFFHTSASRFFLTLCLCSAVHGVLLSGFIAYQFIQPVFLNSEVWVFVYLCLSVSLFVDFLYFYFFDKIKHPGFWYGLFLLFDSLWITFCLHSSLSILYPVLIFAYLLQIAGAGLTGGYKRAFTQALFVSVLLSWMFILYPAEIDQPVVFSFVLNNAVFLSVAGLSGFLGGHWSFLNKSIWQADKMMSHLAHFNQCIVDNINMGLFILDEDMCVVHSNLQAQKILKLPASFTASVHKVFPGLHQYIVSGEAQKYNRFETEYTHGSDKKIIDIFISPFVSDRGKPDSLISPYQPEVSNNKKKFLILFQDVTLIREMEKKIRDREKFSSIGRMATGIAHEIRNPLSSISGSIQLLDLNDKTSAENKRLLELALTETSRLNNIIGNFLDYAGDESSIIQNRPLEPVQVNAVLEDLLDNVRVNPRWEHITHHFTLKAHGFIHAHADRIKQIFLNIIKNACEAMEKQKTGQLEIESFDDNEWVVVRIKDNGAGIEAKDIPCIFEPFYSGKDKGTGLGLSIVHKLVSVYKGRIVVENKKEEENGVICTLHFPIQPASFPGEMAQQKSA